MTSRAGVGVEGWERRSSTWRTLASVGTLLLVVVAVACFVPARRASGIDPMWALREE